MTGIIGKGVLQIVLELEFASGRENSREHTINERVLVRDGKQPAQCRPLPENARTDPLLRLP